MLTSLMLLIAGAAGQAPSATPTDGNKIVCKAERSVGTNLSSRVCKTKAKWAEERAAARDDYQSDVNSRGGTQKPEGWYANPMAAGEPGSGPGFKAN